MNKQPPHTHPGLCILNIRSGTPAQALSLLRGDRLVRINGYEIHDPLDVRFYGSEDVLTLEFERNGKRYSLSVEKEIDEDLGLEFEAPPTLTCKNHCLFCFVHQMPRGLRHALYLKDDDYRLSFLHGNYITLTNCDEADYERIFRQRLSPLYISVHATNDTVRRKILGNPNAPPILPALKRLTEEGIRIHVQVVLCRGINDGKVLERTVSDLAAFYPEIQSVAVVPVGLTRFRKNLPQLSPLTASDAVNLLYLLHPMQERFRKTFGESWIFPADEFYLMAGLPFPPLDTYDDLPQFENGIGMVPLLQQEVNETIRDLPSGRVKNEITIGTGHLAYPVLQELLVGVSKNTGTTINLLAITNHFFGPAVTVSGLLTGSDLLKGFADRNHGKTIYLPSNMLDSGGTLFLDGLTVKDVQKKLDCRLRFITPSAEGLLSPFRKR
ncbi:MAG: DUF512 domain-containing protein [Deltaproteobacteria bacterium]|nr:DUF512 domain-containing protein [Deltaproteobacteria bacterium]